MPDERVEQIKSDVDKYGSFSNLFDAIYEEWRNGGTADSASVAPAGTGSSTVAVPADNTEVIEAVEKAKQAIIEVIEANHPQIEVDVSAPAPVPPSVTAPAPVPERPLAAAPVPSVAPVIDTSSLVTSEAMGVHKADILRQIMDTHQAEVARLDKILEAIEDIMDKVQSVEHGDATSVPVAGIADALITEETPVTPVVPAAVADEPIAAVPVPAVTPMPVADMAVEDEEDAEDNGEFAQELLNTSADDKYFMSAMSELVFDDDEEDNEDEPVALEEDDGIEPFELLGDDAVFDIIGTSLEDDDDEFEDIFDSDSTIEDMDEDDDSAVEDEEEEPTAIVPDFEEIESVDDMLDDLAVLGLLDILEDDEGEFDDKS